MNLLKWTNSIIKLFQIELEGIEQNADSMRLRREKIDLKQIYRMGSFNYRAVHWNSSALEEHKAEATLCCMNSYVSSQVNRVQL